MRLGREDWQGWSCVGLLESFGASKERKEGDDRRAGRVPVRTR